MPWHPAHTGRSRRSALGRVFVHGGGGGWPNGRFRGLRVRRSGGQQGCHRHRQAGLAGRQGTRTAIATGTAVGAELLGWPSHVRIMAIRQVGRHIHMVRARLTRQRPGQTGQDQAQDHANREDQACSGHTGTISICRPMARGDFMAMCAGRRAGRQFERFSGARRITMVRARYAPPHGSGNG